MRLDRISYEYADGTTASYDLHPRLTVIDVHPAHRSVLCGHLLDALTTDSPGIHVEFTDARGRAMVAFRPYGGGHRVIDIERAEDASERYRHAGSVDLLSPLGISGPHARAVMLADRDGLAQSDPSAAWRERLLREDTERLVAEACEVTTTANALRAQQAASGTAVDAAIELHQVYEQRSRLNERERRHNRLRAATLVLGIVGPVGATLSRARIGTTTAFGVIGASLGTAMVCLWSERRLAAAVDEEFSALDAAGVASYDELDARVKDTPLGDAEQRQRLVDASRSHRDASARWQADSGGVPAPWVAARRESLLAAAGERHAGEASGLSEIDGTATATATGRRRDEAAARLAGVTGRRAAITDLAAGEALPLFLDDPLEGLNWEEKVPVLAILDLLADDQQLVICTDDDELLSWARLEAMADRAVVLERNPGRALARRGTGPVDGG